MSAALATASKDSKKGEHDNLDDRTEDRSQRIKNLLNDAFADKKDFSSADIIKMYT